MSATADSEVPLGRRERNKRRTRARIQDAALDLFDRRGFRETTLAQVADAADVALRTVTLHFATKDDLLLGDDAFVAESLRSVLTERADGEDALAAFRRWLAETLGELGADTSWGEVWRRRSARSRLIQADDGLRARVRGGYYELEQVLAEAIAVDLDLGPDALPCRLTAVTVVAGTRELYGTQEARAAEAAATPEAEALLAVVDRVLDYARAGLAVLTR